MTSPRQYEYAYVVEAHDGDTVRMSIDMGFDIWAKKWIRLRSVFAPELSQPGGDVAKTQLEAWLQGHMEQRGSRFTVVTIQVKSPIEIVERQTFTRYVGEIKCSLDGASLNEYMINLGYTDQGDGS